MAYVNRYQLGARWVRSQVQNGLGTPPIVRKVVATANTLGVFKGDFLDETANGVVYPSVNGDGSTYTSLAYVCVGVERYLGADGKIRKGNFLPAATAFTGDADLSNPKASVVLCIPVTGQIFAITVPTATTVALAATYVGQCIDITPGSGSTVTGQSATTAVDPASWESTTTSGQLRLVEIPQIGLTQRNDVTAANWTGHFVAYEIRGII